MNPQLGAVLAAADDTIAGGQVRPAGGTLRVGVDLGTAYTVLVVVDDDGMPVAGGFTPASVVRDGVVVDFVGACRVVDDLKGLVEQRLGQTLRTAAACYPPGVGEGEVQAVRYVVEASGLTCTTLVDEPTAANAVLGVEDGAVVDVGGGTTGTAVISGGQVAETLDEPTGGTHLTLVIAGALGLSFEEAEQRKLDPGEQPRLLGVVRPVFEKIGTIVGAHIAGHAVTEVHLVGGTCAFPGVAEVVSAACGVPAAVPGNPLFVTPLGVARFDTADVTSLSTARVSP